MMQIENCPSTTIHSFGTMKPSAMGHRIARDATCIYLNNLPFPCQGKIRGSLAKVPADRHVQSLRVRSIKFLVLLSLPAADLLICVCAAGDELASESLLGKQQPRQIEAAVN